MSTPTTRSLLRASASLLAAAAALAFACPAEAAPCNLLPKPVYLTGAGKVAIEGLAKALTASGITIIYKLQGSCLAVNAILNGTKLGDPINPANNTATYWDMMGAEQSCDLGGEIADIGLSDVFASTCLPLPNGLPPNVGDFYGPVEAYTFVVPKTSTQTAISKAAGYFVFGFGKDSGVAPWTDESVIFIRDENSGTQQMLGAGISVPPLKWKGTAASSSGDLVTRVTGSMNPEATIGILTAEVAGAHRATLNVLAYQDEGQTCGYWPDSTPTAMDRQNVRDGHYALWGPIHLFTKLDGNGYPLNMNAGDLIGYVTGTKPPPGNFDLIALLAQAGIIPACAMQVKRTSELGPLASFAPPSACGCYFDTLTNSPKAASCTKCTADAECPATTPRCFYGYCETQ